MNAREENKKPEGFAAHIPTMLAILVVLTLLTGIWERPPWSYIAWCIALGVPWLALLAVSWRARSDRLTIGVTLPVFAVLIWISPGGLLSVVQGYLLSACSAFFFWWLGRRRIQRFIDAKRV
jgi:hypothetical protein